MIPRRTAALPVAIVLTLATTCALIAPSGTHAQPAGPLDVALQYLEPRKARPCSEIWALLSAGTQENARAEARRRERDRDGLPQAEKPEERHCSAPIGTLKRETVRLVRQEADAALVAADFVVKAPRHRYDIYFTPTKVTTREVSLVREAGAWRVDLPRANVGRGEQSRLLEIGPVDVILPLNFTPGLVDRLEATTVVRASRDALEPALRNPQRWARALPAVQAAQPLERSGELERVQLTFAEPDRALPVHMRFFGKREDSPTRESVLQWDAENGKIAPVYFRGSWTLKPHQDGSTRVTLLVYIDRKQWPGDTAQRNFSAERLAQAVLDFEKAAIRPVP